MARYCKMSKKVGKLGSFETESGDGLGSHRTNLGSFETESGDGLGSFETEDGRVQDAGGLGSYRTHFGAFGASDVWIAPPVPARWAEIFGTGTLVATGHTLKKDNSGNFYVANASGKQVTAAVSAKTILADKYVRDPAGKIGFQAGQLRTGGSEAQPTHTAPVAAPGTDWASALTGVGSILGSVLAPAATVYATHLQSKAEKDALKYGGGGGGGMPMMMPAPSGGIGAGAIIGIVAVVMVMMGGMFMMMNRAPAKRKSKKRAKRSKK